MVSVPNPRLETSGEGESRIIIPGKVAPRPKLDGSQSSLSLSPQRLVSSELLALLDASQSAARVAGSDAACSGGISPIAVEI